MEERASARGRTMARARWAADRKRRDQLATLTPERDWSRISKRIIVVWDERTVHEAVIRDWDSAREARRKEREVLRRHAR